jgi:hypothetical protein
MSEKTPIVSIQASAPEDPNVPKATSTDDEEAEALLNEYANMEQSEKSDNVKGSKKSEKKVADKEVESEKVVEKGTVTEAVEEEVQGKPEPIDSDKVVAVEGVVDLTEDDVVEDVDVPMEDVSGVAKAPGKPNVLSFVYDMLMNFEFFG